MTSGDPADGCQSHVSHAENIVCFPKGSNKQVAWAVVNANHRVGSIPEQVPDDLLELDTITHDGREVLGEIQLQGDTISLKIAHRQDQSLLGWPRSDPAAPK